ncbi:hypothetical protein [Bacillus cereus]|uniref:Uncharacterized protein n=1 Tax=Bacillus cereus HuA3-9 TaxID=1053205 RepID=R8CIG8_BACCE|nr:hypothetical protein [Bacillus cereus]EOO11387.1 hypothetical protein IGA_05650 [Bacillus cereus HuA3-9]
MNIIQKEFDSYGKMIEYLSMIEELDGASFKFKNGLWVLDIIKFDRALGYLIRGE